MYDELGDHAVVERGNQSALLYRRVEPDPFAVRRAPETDSPGRRRKSAFRVLGDDASLDRVAMRRDVALLDAQRLAPRDFELQLHEVGAGDHLGNGMLDLDASVDLYEVEIVTVNVVQKLYRSRVAIADRRQEIDRGLVQPCARRFGKRSSRRLLDHFLIAALQGALALAEMQHAALAQSPTICTSTCRARSTKRST